MFSDKVFEKVADELREATVGSKDGFFFIMYTQDGPGITVRASGGLTIAAAASLVREMIDRFGPHVILHAIQIDRGEDVDGSEKQNWPDVVE